MDRTAATAVFAAALMLTAAAPGLQDFVADRPAPLAANSVLAERLLGPTTRARLAAAFAAGGKAVAAFALPGPEPLAIHVPPAPPPAAGYGLLVFVPPWEDARLPSGWAAALDRAGVIAVTAARFGNSQDVERRRVPLALTAADAVIRAYPVDRARVFVGGFSGGSRVAWLLAVGWPDVFGGVLLDAGSDAIGRGGVAVPPPARRALLERSRIVFATGRDDAENLARDADTRASLADWCLAAEVVPGVAGGHAVIDGPTLARTLRLLDRPAAGGDARCTARRDARVAAAEATLRQPGLADRTRDALWHDFGVGEPAH